MMKLAIAAVAIAVAMPAAAQTGAEQAKIDQAISKKRKEVCKTEIETGSLVKRVRRCASAESWARRTDGENRAARDFVQAQTGLILSN
ncbi:hypothetical protein ABC347_13685 [Sphingomonas sp. 1P06PA]|uniref:hypothetical protein n=1 Tax=Sphingomonas sp. 1P06PA TaxID=554121 RepID=UPI0039A6C7D6